MSHVLAFRSNSFSRDMIHLPFGPVTDTSPGAARRIVQPRVLLARVELSCTRRSDLRFRGEIRGLAQVPPLLVGFGASTLRFLGRARGVTPEEQSQRRLVQA